MRILGVNETIIDIIIFFTVCLWYFICFVKSDWCFMKIVTGAFVI